MNGLIPTPKMAASGITGSLAVVLFWILHQYCNINPPAEVTAAATLILAWVSGYFAPKSQSPPPTQPTIP